MFYFLMCGILTIILYIYMKFMRVIGILTKRESSLNRHEPRPANRSNSYAVPPAIALQSSAKILPVIISRSPATLTKREKWYQIPKRNLFSVCMWGDDIEVNPINGKASRSLAMRTITRQLEEYFIERQVHYENP